ncbi:MAG: zf-HC2 domain-containing protein [Actinomycetota bacterium]|nr:zf-HC2 domain-containing protein [Actinomycetota bacterium]
MDMTRFPRGVLCERARAWASLAPDSELSELERKLLDSHLERCSACASFAVQVAAVAAELRAASFQPLLRPISVPSWHRRRVYARVRAVGAAAAVAVMALGIAARAPLANEEQSSFQFPRVVDFSGGEQAEIQRLRNLRTAALAAERQARNRPARHFGNQPA